MRVQFTVWCNEKPIFSIPFFIINEVDAWIHEFNEYAVWCVLRSLGFTANLLNDPISIILNNGEKREQNISHIIVSLHNDSYFQVYENMPNYHKWINPDNYATLVLKRA